jgi:hypothetical protein
VRPVLDAGPWRGLAAQARDRAGAALRWLALPAQRDWQAWRRWAGLNLGLASAASVAVGAALIALTLGAYQVCCGAAPAGARAPWLSQQVLAQPAPRAVPIDVPESAAVPAQMQVLVTPTPLPITTPVPVAEPAAPGPSEAHDPPPLMRSVRPAAPEPAVMRSLPKPRAVAERATVAPPSAANASRAPIPTGPSDSPAQPGWYVKR